MNPMTLPPRPATGEEDTPRRRGGVHPGPPLALGLAISVVALLAGVAVGPVAGAGPVPAPSAGADAVADWFGGHHGAASTTALLQLLSASALVFWAATAWSRLDFLAPKAPGATITGAGGLAAAGLLATSGAVTWALGSDVATDEPGVALLLHRLNFVAGGPAHVVALGVAVVGLAVTCLFVRRTPRPLALVGLGIALVDLLALLSLVVPALVVLVPLGRFASLAWLLAMSVLLPRDRAPRGR